MRRRLTCSALCLLALAACGGQEQAPTDPLDQMTVAFLDPPLKPELQRKLDAALAATMTTPTADNYSRAGSTLVTLRKDSGADEMRMLDCIPGSARDPRLPGVSFSNAAALCSLIVSGQLPK